MSTAILRSSRKYPRPTKAAGSGALFDHLVGDGERRWRHFEAERLGGSQVDGEIEFVRLLYG
jgi:hypothetical protein